MYYDLIIHKLLDYEITQSYVHLRVEQIMYIVDDDDNNNERTISKTSITWLESLYTVNV